MHILRGRVLCLNNNLDHLIELLEDEYNRFIEILELKMEDFYRYNNSTSSTLFYIKSILSKFVKQKSEEINEFIANIDTKLISDKLKKIIDENIKKYKGLQI